MLTTHTAENNQESRANLERNRPRFNRVCQLVYTKLMAGERLTVRQCAIDGISSLPRRIADLRENGVLITDFWFGKVKQYQMLADDRFANVHRFGPTAKAAP